MADDTDPRGLRSFTVIHRLAGANGLDEVHAAVVLARSPAEAAGRALARATAEEAEEDAVEEGRAPNYRLSGWAMTFGVRDRLMGVYEGRVRDVRFVQDRPFNIEAFTCAEAALAALRDGDLSIRTALFGGEETA